MRMERISYFPCGISNYSESHQYVLCLCTIFILLQDKLQLVSILGAGLLVGTALAVIIPEGIRALFSGGTTSDKGFHGM